MECGLRRLTEVRRSGAGSRRRVTLYLDGELWRTTTWGVLRDLGLAVDCDLDPVAVDRDARNLERSESRERALRLLGYRERSAAELRRRLEEDGYPVDIAAVTVEELQAAGLVDDERFAALLARSLVTLRGYGRSRARRELARYGLSEEIAQAALDEIAPAEMEADRASDAAQRARRPSDTPDRLAARLVRRGFSPGVALDAARGALPSAADTSDSDT